MTYAVLVLKAKIVNLEKSKDFMDKDDDSDLIEQVERRVDEIHAAIQILNAREN